MNSLINTRYGKKVDLLDPQPEAITIDDIAHSLARTNRYYGHASFPVSVAQHSVVVACICPAELQLVALLHDATECYVGDVARPVKQLCPEFDILEARFWKVIAAKFGLPADIPQAVKDADDEVLRAEMEFHFFGQRPTLVMATQRWSVDYAQKAFLRTFQRLNRKQDLRDLAGIEHDAEIMPHERYAAEQAHKAAEGSQ